MHRAQGNSYTEAAKNGEEVLQRLGRSATESQVVAELYAEANPAVVSETTMVPVEPSIQSDVSLSGREIAPPVQKTPPFPVLKTTFISICTSIVGATALTALAFISESFTLPQAETPTAPSAEESDPHEDLPSKINDPSEPEAHSEPDTFENSESNTVTSIAAAPPLTLTQSIAESSAVWAIATYSDEGRNINLIVSGEESGLITIRDQGSGQPVRTLEAHDDTVRAIEIAPNTRRLISSSGDGIKVWNLETGELLYRLPSSTPVWSIAIAPDESRFVSGADDGSLAAWDLETGQSLYSTSDGATIWSVAVAPDGKSFVSGDSNRVVCQRDLATGQLLKTFKGHQSNVRAVAISPDGQTLASGSWDKTIKLWSLETGELQATLEGHRDHIVSLAISSDGDMLASGSTDTTVKLWSLSDLSDYKLLENLEAHSDWVLATVFKDRERTLITGSKDKTIKIWE